MEVPAPAPAPMHDSLAAPGNPAGNTGVSEMPPEIGRRRAAVRVATARETASMEVTSRRRGRSLTPAVVREAPAVQQSATLQTGPPSSAPVKAKSKAKSAKADAQQSSTTSLTHRSTPTESVSAPDMEAPQSSTTALPQRSVSPPPTEAPKADTAEATAASPLRVAPTPMPVVEEAPVVPLARPAPLPTPAAAPKAEAPQVPAPAPRSSVPLPTPMGAPKVEAPPSGPLSQHRLAELDPSCQPHQHQHKLPAARRLPAPACRLVVALPLVRSSADCSPPVRTLHSALRPLQLPPPQHHLC